MEITTINQILSYQKTDNSLQRTAVNNSGNSTGRNSPAYKVNLSSAGRSRSLSSFNRTQQLEKNSFQRIQRIDEASNDRELANEKAVFERKQAAELRNFENTQSIKKAKFMRSINRSGG